MSNKENYNFFVAKKDGNKWLPLWMHLRDTAEIIKKIIKKWVPFSTITSAGLSEDEFEVAAIFLAAVHDIGKATSYFQSLITKDIPDQRYDIEKKGFIINDEYLNRGKTPHAYVGEEILKKVNNDQDRNKLNAYASVIGAHHGKPQEEQYICGAIKIDYFEDYKTNIFGKEDKNEEKKWENVWKSIIEDAYIISGIKSFADLPDINLQAQTILSALVIMADWMASNQYYFPLIDNECFIALNDVDYKKRIDIAWEKFAFPERWESEICKMNENIFEERFQFVPNEVQKTFYSIVNEVKNPGLFILEAQMGVGKTEAALAAAELLANKRDASGIFFGLPTQATSNGLFPRMIEWAKNVSDETVNSVCLAHGSAELNDAYQQYEFKGDSVVSEDIYDSGLEVHPWFKGNKKSLLADFVIGTVDQFLLASLKRKHYMLRHLGLSNKIVIIDECHAYDAYMNEYMLASLRWMGAYGVPVIMLSATLPKDRRVKFIEEYSKYYVKCVMDEKPKDINKPKDWDKNDNYPLFTWTDGLSIYQKSLDLKSENKIISVSYVNNIEMMLERINKKLQKGGCACIIANTVKRAQEIYDIAKGLLDGYKLILYHAQYIMPDRLKKENELLDAMGKKSNSRKRDRVILIGTQVLEQSLDYDADIMVTQLCPIDLLFQRMGRLHRHNRIRPDDLKKPELIVLKADDENIYDEGTKKIYGDFLLNRTYEILLQNKNKVSIPSDISPLVQKVYDIDAVFTEDEIFRNEYCDLIKRKESSASKFALNKPSKVLKTNMDGMLKIESQCDGESAVRDGMSSISVIVLKRSLNSVCITVDNKNTYNLQLIPSELEAKEILKQRINLPLLFSSPYMINDVISELEIITSNSFTIWQGSSWLKGELFLLLNEENIAELGNYTIKYDMQEGLIYKKKES